jgi:hypothetical protein
LFVTEKTLLADDPHINGIIERAARLLLMFAVSELAMPCDLSKLFEAVNQIVRINMPETKFTYAR